MFGTGDPRVYMRDRDDWRTRQQVLMSSCDDCGADAGESCRPYCTGAAAYNDVTDKSR
jgi:hypothetical protein